MKKIGYAIFIVVEIAIVVMIYLYNFHCKDHYHFELSQFSSGANGCVPNIKPK